MIPGASRMTDDARDRSIEWLKREISDTAGYAHKAMWFSAIAAMCGILSVLRMGGFL
jgi:hypothetical protein